MEEQQGLRCGEANPNQGLGGTSVKDPVPVVSVNPVAEPRQPSAPVLIQEGNRIRRTVLWSFAVSSFNQIT